MSLAILDARSGPVSILQLGENTAEAARQAAAAASSAATATMSADAAAASAHFYATRAEAVAALAVGAYFTSAETGTLRMYKRTGTSPFYADQGDAAAPVGRGSLSTDGTLAGNSDTVVPTQKAVKTYVDGPRFAQSGTGAVARTVPDKLRDLHSIRDFGGVGGGVINDSGADAAMRAAVKAAGGGAMVYPAISGGYKIGTRARSPGILIEEADFPAFFGEEPPGLLRVYTRNNGAGGTGESGITSFMVNGTGNMVPFSTIGGTDSVALSAVVYSGEDAPNPVCAVNIVSRYAGLPPGINWGLEIDMNNESPTAYSAGDPRGGQGIVLNTGSTYSPDTGIVIQRGTGEGTGPGWKQGIGIKGARDVGILVQAMSSSTAPGMSPAATGTIAALVVNVGGDAFNRFVLTESGQMFWSSGASAADVNLSRGGAGVINCSGVFGATQYWVGANAVVGSRRTGWTAPTGTLSRATFDEATVTLPQLAQRVAALITDLHGQAGGHGIIGN